MKSGFAYAAAISSCALYCLNGGSDGALSRWAPLVASCQCVLKELGELLQAGWDVVCSSDGSKVWGLLVWTFVSRSSISVMSQVSRCLKRC